MAAHYLRIAAVASLGAGNTAVNTYHYSADGVGVFGLTAGAVVTQANNAITQLRTYYNALATAGLLFQWTIGAVVTEHQTGQPPQYVAATPLNSTLVGGTLAALQVAAVISWRTALAGKSFRGRSYIGPLRSTSFTYPDLANTIPTAFMAAANALIAAPSSADLVPAVYSPTLDQTTRITSSLCTQALRTMRSRAS